MSNYMPPKRILIATRLRRKLIAEQLERANLDGPVKIDAVAVKKTIKKHLDDMRDRGELKFTDPLKAQLWEARKQAKKRQLTLKRSRPKNPLASTIKEKRAVQNWHAAKDRAARRRKRKLRLMKPSSSSLR